jgi:hypothetical protein
MLVDGAPVILMCNDHSPVTPVAKGLGLSML